MNPDDELGDRRPLTSRQTGWARRMAHYLGDSSITPNQISGLSVVFACIATVGFVISGSVTGWAYALCMLLVVVGCQLRLVCNLMDGMVAIEAGKQTPDGALWNEFPDRMADIVIIVALGVAVDWSAAGWAGAAMAVLVAYTRELGKGIDGVVDFTGPMAKPHRMALISVGAVCSAASVLVPINTLSLNPPQLVLKAVLVLLLAGCVLTVCRRVRAMQQRLC